ncbi:MAG: hypothetical protein JXX14_00110 [Deltaproteobacteria bacterium]|nr:hypothetical protein [Deltaproteobacteria bacterium]
MRNVLSSIMTIICGALFTQGYAGSADAYYIDTGVSDPCHEKMTAELLLDFFDEHPDVAMHIPLPQNMLWEMYADAIFENFKFEVTSLEQKYFIASLLIGTRWPDEHGRSVTSLASLYDTHGEPNDQHEHFLRRLEHDFDRGNVEAIGYSTGFIAERIEKALALLDQPRTQQIVPVTEYVEFYGQITLYLWGPAYYTGLAIHTLQDSFSHTVRSDDLHRIVHVMNFLDAVTDEYDPARDGLAHSYGMDECSKKNRPIYTAAKEAATEVLDIFVTGNPQTIITVEDNWLGYTEGCTMANHFCNTRWYENVTADPTGPIVGCVFSPVLETNQSLLYLFSRLMI